LHVTLLTPIFETAAMMMLLQRCRDGFILPLFAHPKASKDNIRVNAKVCKHKTIKLLIEKGGTCNKIRLTFHNAFFFLDPLGLGALCLSSLLQTLELSLL
jgi:hypothetical protein